MGEQLEVIEVAANSIHPNPWNPNVMDDRTFEAERESIRTYGFIDPVTVRPHPEIDGEWQIVDGEQRWRAAIEEGAETVAVIPRELSDAAAKKLTIIMNETRGEADVALLGKLLGELREEVGEEDVLTGLALSERELAQLSEIGAADWDSFSFEQEPRNTKQLVSQIMELRFDDEQRESYKRLVKHLQRELKLATAEEVVLECLSRARASL